MEVSAAFPKREGSIQKNYVSWEGMNEDELNAWDTPERYRVKGMHDGWFYYHDLYAKRILGFGWDYLAVSEKKKADFVPPKGYKLAQEFNEDTAKMVCDEVNRQLIKAFRWMERFKKSAGDVSFPPHTQNFPPPP